MRLSGSTDQIDVEFVEREATPRLLMKLGIQLYLAELSLSNTVSILEVFGVNRARSTVHNWVHKADLQTESGHSPDHVAVDETVIQLADQRYWLYAAVDPETNGLPHTKLEPTRTNVIAHAFFTELREKHDVDDVVFLVDSAIPLKDACQRHVLDFRYERNGNRNSVERIFREVKLCTYSFSNCFSNADADTADDCSNPSASRGISSSEHYLLVRPRTFIKSDRYIKRRMSQTTNDRRRSVYISGEWMSGTEEIHVTDLVEGGTFATIEGADVPTAKNALAAAQRVKPTLRETTIPQRCAWLESIADGIESRKEELAEVIVREAGKPISSARSEVDSAAERFRRAREEVRSLKGEFREGTTDGHEGWEAIVRHEPVGTVLCVTPYNYPLATTALQVAPALAAGNAILLKPASETPISAVLLAEIIADAGLPDGTFNFVPGRSLTIGDTLAGDERVNAIALTGSTGAGKHVADDAGMVTLHMELGGNAPAIVFPDADFATASESIAAGAVKYAGQRCSAVSRAIVHESIHDELIEQFDAELDSWVVGDLFEEDTDLGPVISENQATWIQNLVDDAIDRGATLVRGGTYEETKPGVFTYEPTLLSEVPATARIVHEEQFGPVLPVATFANEDDALELVNETELALDGAVFTNDYDRAFRVAEAVDAGSIRINGAPSHGLGDLPFGGNGSSGINREGLHVTIEDFVRTKTIVL